MVLCHLLKVVREVTATQTIVESCWILTVTWPCVTMGCITAMQNAGGDTDPDKLLSPDYLSMSDTMEIPGALSSGTCPTRETLSKIGLY